MGASRAELKYFPPIRHFVSAMSVGEALQRVTDLRSYRRTYYVPVKGFGISGFDGARFGCQLTLGVNRYGYQFFGMEFTGSIESFGEGSVIRITGASPDANRYIDLLPMVVFPAVILAVALRQSHQSAMWIRLLIWVTATALWTLVADRLRHRQMQFVANHAKVALAMYHVFRATEVSANADLSAAVKEWQANPDSQL